MTCSYVHRVRVPEVDNQGYLFNSRYLEIADAALTEFFRAGGFTLQELFAYGCDPSVVETTVKYIKPARLDDQLTIMTSCQRVGSSSFEMTFDVHISDTLTTSIRTVYVNVDAMSATSRPIPRTVAEYLQSTLKNSRTAQHVLDTKEPS